ncbi:HlyD family secretion protein [Enterococcus sp. DIV0212c]|uniref:efflux RND transporter periplasmic adaptor subunit n=1 Tax=Enterococcus sp. DIV0212c TaxID=2230867 RepID=UPI001A9B4864|nr:HlyD family efflux transporter periplasmic adaptor subunit [Enterococcus sp. DIV0212c]MBO1353509.1 HlyD family efflux transporter periplasmic adaptor subunit [Enterococcus sp. DIV0212c]
MKSKKMKLVIGGILIGVCVGSYFLFFSSSKKVEPSYKVFTLNQQDPLLLKGEVKATQTEDIFYDQTLGTITDIPVKNEQEVKNGDVVLNYLNGEAQTRVDQQQRAVNKSNLSAQQAAQNLSRAQARYNEAQASLNQINANSAREADPEKKEELKGKSEQQKAEVTGTNNEVIQAQQALDLAYAEVNDESAALETEQGKVTSSVKSTIDGVAMVNEAGKKSLDQPLIQVLSKTKQIKGIVTEYDLNKLKVGQEVSVTSIGSNQTAQGKISNINQLPKSKNGNDSEIPTYEFIVEGEFPWAYGSSTQVSLPQPQLVLPEKSVISKDNKTFVFAYKNGRAVKTDVKVSDVNGAKNVESGVSKGTKIIGNPDDVLKDNTEVQVVEND